MIQSDFIKKIKEINEIGKPILVTKHFENPEGDISIGRWLPLSTNPAIIDYRTILHNELVFDIDFKDWKYVRQYGEKLEKHLNQRGIPYIIGITGGKGLHISIFMSLKVPKDLKEKLFEAKNKGYSLRHLRMSIWTNILKDIGVDQELVGRGKPFDDCVVNFDDNSKGHILRIFGGRKFVSKDELGKVQWAYKTLIETIPQGRVRLKNMQQVKYPDKIELWNVPAIIIKKSINDFLKKFSEPERQRVIKKYEGVYTNLPCVQTAIEMGSDEGQRHDAALIVALACALDNLEERATMELLKRYHHSCQERGGLTQFSLKELKGWVDWLKRKELPSLYWDRNVTCKMAHGLGFACGESCEDCPLNKMIHKDAIEFLNTKGIFEQIQEQFGKVIVNEEESRMLLWFCYLSTYMESKIHPQLIGESSIGKSFIMNRILEFVPDEDVLSKFTGASSKSFNYYLTQNPDIQKIEVEGRMVPNIDGKIIVVQEFEGAQEAVVTLRPLMSGDQNGLKIITVDKDDTGKNAYREMICHGLPVFACATTNYKLDKEFITRTWRLECDESQEQTRAVMEFQAEEDIDPGCHVAEKMGLIIDAICLLKTQIGGVINPYSLILARKMPLGKDMAFIRLRRDFKKIKTFIKICAWLHQFQRPKIKIDDQTYVLATLEDYEIVKKLIEPSFEMIFAGNAAMKKCLKICKERGETSMEITSTVIASETGWSTQKARGVLFALENKGFLLQRKEGKSYKYEMRDKKKATFPTLDVVDLQMYYNEIMNDKPRVAEMLKKTIGEEK